VTDDDIELRERIRAPEDARLAHVYKQLMRRKRKTGAFLCPTKLDFGIDTAEERQCAAIGMLYQAAIEPTPPVIRKEDCDTMRDKLAATAAEVRMRVSELKELGVRSVRHELGDCPATDPWLAVADDMENTADGIDRTAFVVERDRGMLFERALSVQIASMMKLLFDTVQPGLVAKLVEAATGRSIEAWRIREWLASAEKG
jgi:hypothetical protein